MNVEALLDEGLVMVVIGMGTVFVFLCVMVWAMDLMSACVAQLNKWFPEAVPEPAKRPVAASDDAAVALAIAVAASKG